MAARPTPPAGYSYCTPTCYCRNCTRLERSLIQQAQTAAPAIAAAERIINPVRRPRCQTCDRAVALHRDFFGRLLCTSCDA